MTEISLGPSKTITRQAALNSSQGAKRRAHTEGGFHGEPPGE
jgi:hypothetical protein